jgi:Dolichyl-phosphate-mannose-protein mannosyltransferase/Tetratricopeptide repeat
MHGVSADRSSSLPLKPIVVFGVLAFVLALRLAHLSSALVSPLSYQPGPDEEYYLRFGQAVLAGHGQDAPEFTFMDPAYGYLLGAVFKLIGVSPLAIYALQCLLDTGTAFGIICIGRLLGRPRAGVYGALLYGATSTAIMFSATLLKEVWVTSLFTWWVACALAVIRSERKIAWLAFGLLCGSGIGFRSTFLLLGIAGLLLPLLGIGLEKKRNVKLRWGESALVACGMMLAVMPWSLRNEHAYGSLSFLPHNGGVVLHQVYNVENPDSSIWIPNFVNYLEPAEIWRGYANEASRREGRALSPPEVDTYWKSQALGFMQQNPGRVLQDVWCKTLKFFAAGEIPINRSLTEEAMFSPVLRMLPMPAALLLALGFSGLIWLATEDRRWSIVAVPIAVALFTMVFFWAEDRFRFHAMGILALCAGIWADSAIRNLQERRTRWVAGFAGLAAMLGVASVALGTTIPAAPIHWDHIVWGYIKMGKIQDARTLALRIAGEQPENGPIMEALGFTAIKRMDFAEAAHDYERAIAIRPRSHVAHYNLAKVYLELGNRVQALDEAQTAARLDPTTEYQALVRQIEAGN